MATCQYTHTQYYALNCKLRLPHATLRGRSSNQLSNQRKRLEEELLAPISVPLVAKQVHFRSQTPRGLKGKRCTPAHTLAGQGATANGHNKHHLGSTQNTGAQRGDQLFCSRALDLSSGTHHIREARYLQSSVRIVPRSSVEDDHSTR